MPDPHSGHQPPPDDIILRPAGPQDADAIAALHAASWRSAYRGILPDAFLDGPVVAERAARWRAHFAAPQHGRAVLAAEGADGLHGFIALTLAPQGGTIDGFDAEIVNLHVDPARKSRGLGRRLIAAGAEALIAAGKHNVFLWVYTANRPAVRFYEAIGGEVGGRPQDTGTEAIAGIEVPHRRYIWRDLSPLTNPISPTAARPKDAR